MLVRGFGLIGRGRAAAGVIEDELLADLVRLLQMGQGVVGGREGAGRGHAVFGKLGAGVELLVASAEDFAVKG